MPVSAPVVGSSGPPAVGDAASPAAGGCGDGKVVVAVTESVTVDVLVAPLASVIVYVKLSVPAKPAAGVYVQVALVQETVP